MLPLNLTVFSASRKSSSDATTPVGKEERKSLMLHELSITQVTDKLKAGEVSAVEVLNSCLERIRQVDPQVGAFLSLDEASALRDAEQADQEIRQGVGWDRKPLLGIPIALKDVIAVKGQPLTCGSRMLAGFVSPYDAHVTTKLKEAGAVLFGRLNMDEFAMGSSTENSAFHPTRNPWDLSRIPGGSSGGSAAAVAAHECFAALGSDTGGSVRQPAALCGVVGLKPTYGRVSRFGLVAFASSLDQIGPITKTVRDAAKVLTVISGPDSRDSTSLGHPAPAYERTLEDGIQGLRLGMPREYRLPGTDPEVEQAVTAAVKRLESLGAEIVEISLPHTEYAVATYYIIATAEASANLARYDGIRYGHRSAGTDLLDVYAKTRGEGFGTEVKRRLMLGTYVLSSGYYDAYYLRAQKVRTLIRNDFLKAFDSVDAIVTPTTPSPAFRLGEKSQDPLQMYLYDIFTLSCNLAGIPGISLPCGFTEAPRLPIGLQLLGPPLGESDLLRIAHAYEQSTDWTSLRPPIA
jgi:aspartyl-tRNA(Asn)/glutamyl-tRNA(Gln) amidotransferase subunit A